MTLEIKSQLSIILLAQALIALFSMLELRGREPRFNPKALRLIHRINGYCFVILYLVLSYYCLPFLKNVPSELSNRALLHSLFAIGVGTMLGIKILFISVYKKFIDKVLTYGLTIFFLSMLLIATSGGYYFIAQAQVKSEPSKITTPASTGKIPGNAEKGEKLFEQWCFNCHEAYSNANKLGPGLKGVLKGKKLPFTGQTANPENIRKQLRNPYQFMPPQVQLSDKDVEDIIEFLKTL